MTPEELERIGQALYGARWKSPLARALGTSHRTVWARSVGEHRPRPRSAKAIRELPAKVKAERLEILKRRVAEAQDAMRRNLSTRLYVDE
jgi:hypothetical protein